jgi:hypothetical protein
LVEYGLSQLSPLASVIRRWNWTEMTRVHGRRKRIADRRSGVAGPGPRVLAVAAALVTTGPTDAAETW